MTGPDGIDEARWDRAMRIPTVRDPATSTLIELLTVNARLPYPLHMPLWVETQPGAELAIRTVGALDGMRLEEEQLGLYLWNKDNRLVAVMYEQQPRGMK